VAIVRDLKRGKDLITCMKRGFKTIYLPFNTLSLSLEGWCGSGGTVLVIVDPN